MNYVLVDQRQDQALGKHAGQLGQLRHVVLELSHGATHHEFPVFILQRARLQPGLQERHEVLVDIAGGCVGKFLQKGGEDVVSAQLLLLAVLFVCEYTALKKVLDGLEDRLFGFLFFGGVLAHNEFFEYHLHLRFQLLLAQLDLLGASLPVLRLTLGLGLVVGVVAAFTLGVPAVALVAAAAISRLGVSRGDRRLLIHVDLLAVASVVAVVVTATVTAVPTTTTATTSTAVAALVSVVLTLACLLGGLSLAKHLLLDLLFSFDFLITRLKFGPSELLVFKHVLDQFLDAFAHNARAGCGLFRSLPDRVEVLQNVVVLFLRELAALRFAALRVLILGLQLFLNSRSDLLDKLDRSLHGIIEEASRVEQMLENRFGSVSSEQVAREELANELNVTEQLMLALHHDLTVVVLRVLLARILGLLLKHFEIVLLEDFFEATATEVEELLAEGAELQVVGDGAFALRLEVDFDNRGAKLAVEFGVGVLDLGFAEDSLDDDLQDLLVNRESLCISWVETRLT